MIDSKKACTVDVKVDEDNFIQKIENVKGNDKINEEVLNLVNIVLLEKDKKKSYKKVTVGDDMFEVVRRSIGFKLNEGKEDVVVNLYKKVNLVVT